MSESRTTEILERMLSGSQYITSVYDTDIDIAAPKQFSITTVAKKASLTITIKAPTAAVVVFNTGLVIGTGGGASAGSAVTLGKRDQADTSTAITLIKQDYVLGSSGQSAGTAVQTNYVFPNLDTVIKYKLKENTAYGLVLTTVADNNQGQFTFEIDE